MWKPEKSVLSRIRRKKIKEHLVPTMEEFGIDLWLVLQREAQDDPDTHLWKRERQPHLDPIASLVAGEMTIFPSAFLFKIDGDNIAIIEEGDATYVTESKVYSEVQTYKYTRWNGLPDFLELLKKAVAIAKPERIGINFSETEPIADGLTYGMKLLLKKTIGPELSNKLVSAEDIVVSIWGRKVPEEVDYIKSSSEKAHKLMMETFEAIIPGETTEKQAFNMIRDKMLINGWEVGWAENICPIVKFGSDPHVSPDVRVAEKGQLLTINAGVMTNGYSTDLNRSAYVLRNGEKEPPKEILNMWRLARNIVDATVDNLVPGKIGIDFHNAAINMIKNAGYKEFWYQLAHPVGVWVHDLGPYLGPAQPHYGGKVYMKLKENDVFACEPGINKYVPELKSIQRVKLQEMIICKEKKGEYLIPEQEELYLI